MSPFCGHVCAHHCALNGSCDLEILRGEIQDEISHGYSQKEVYTPRLESLVVMCIKSQLSIHVLPEKFS